MSLREDINELQNAYPRLSVAPSINDSIFIRGVIDFSRTSKGTNPIVDSYQLLIEVPSDFPKSLPIVKEIGNKIPKKSDFHINSDGTLCLGSPLKLLLHIFNNPNLIRFVEDLLIPFLYQVSNKLKGGEFILGELEHGVVGEISDYEDIFGVNGALAIKNTLLALSCKKRTSNKMACPCGCGARLGCCKFHYKLNSLRKALNRKVYKKILNEFNKRLSQI